MQRDSPHNCAIGRWGYVAWEWQSGIPQDAERTWWESVGVVFLWDQKRLRDSTTLALALRHRSLRAIARLMRTPSMFLSLAFDIKMVSDLYSISSQPPGKSTFSLLLFLGWMHIQSATRMQGRTYGPRRAYGPRPQLPRRCRQYPGRRLPRHGSIGHKVDSFL